MALRIAVLAFLLLVFQRAGAAAEPVATAATPTPPAQPAPVATPVAQPAPVATPVAQPAPVATPLPETATDPAAMPAPVSTQYRIGVSDVVQIQVYGEAGLSGAFTVDDSGALDFPLLGAVPVQGLTTAEISALLKSRLTPGYLVNPSVTATVVAYQSQPVQVLGAVGKPGLYYLRGPTTVLQILGLAGGVSHDGVNEVKITHAGQNDATIVMYGALVSGGDVPVLAGDIITVPQSLVSVMGQVAHPGEIGFRAGMTISQCIAEAGGALTTANLGGIYILRGQKRIRISLRKILSGRAVDVVVQPGDRVFVKESAV